jgi:gamma-glutamyl hercynylcysteine S-oxide synthase
MLTAQRDRVVAFRLLERFEEARQKSDALFEIVRPEALYDRPIPERHRIIFYIGHLEAFDWNLLHETVFGLKAFNSELDRLFAFGIDPVGGGLPTDRVSDWPSIERVREYVKGVRSALDEKTSEDFDPQIQARDGFPLDTLLNVAIEHRLMHVETLAYMLHQLPLNRKISRTRPVLPLLSAVPHSMVGIPAGDATLGLSRNSDAFGWDNEFESHMVHVPAFEIDRYMVTNQQFLEFLQAGGYEAREIWSDLDWNWKNDRRIAHPVFWNKNGESWLYQTMFEEIPLPPDWPVYVSHAEAAAYARWVGKALPTEDQWHRGAYGTPEGTQRLYPWGDEPPTSNRGNFDFYSFDPQPVNAHPQGQSAFGIEGLLGNGWEWTSSVFGPFPGFRPFPFYRGYSADFFDGKHFVMKGGSARTAACMLRPTFRNWFQAHYQYVYAGFRCVNA